MCDGELSRTLDDRRWESRPLLYSLALLFPYMFGSLGPWDACCSSFVNLMRLFPDEDAMQQHNAVIPNQENMHGSAAKQWHKELPVPRPRFLRTTTAFVSHCRWSQVQFLKTEFGPGFFLITGTTMASVVVPAI